MTCTTPAGSFLVCLSTRMRYQSRSRSRESRRFPSEEKIERKRWDYGCCVRVRVRLRLCVCARACVYYPSIGCRARASVRLHRRAPALSHSECASVKFSVEHPAHRRRAPQPRFVQFYCHQLNISDAWQTPPGLFRLRTRGLCLSCKIRWHQRCSAYAPASKIVREQKSLAD